MSEYRSLRANDAEIFAAIASERQRQNESIELIASENFVSQAVLEAAVTAMPDQKWGERVHAVVVPHDGAEVGETELLDWCKDRIAGYKRPRSLSFIDDDDMPRTATGKILHRELRLQFSGD